MATVLSLVRMGDGLSETGEVSLATGADDITLAANGWTPQVGEDNSQPVIETIRVQIKSTSHDALATALQKLAAMAERVRQYRDGITSRGVWLKTKLQNETGTRYALVLAMGHKPVSSISRMDMANAVTEYAITLQRRPYWEQSSPLQFNFVSPQSSVGGTYDAGATWTVKGDVAARLYYAIINVPTAGLQEFWIGFRSNERYDVTRGNFQSTWSLRKSGSFGADTTGGTSNADATAKDGYKVVCTFATTASLAERCRMRVRDLLGGTTNEADQRGNFLVLARAKCSAAGTVRMRLTDGFYYNASMNKRSRVVVSSTSWYLYEMGRVNIPAMANLEDIGLYPRDFSLAIDAERVSGSCNLEIDCLILLPTEGLAYGKTATAMTAMGLLVLKENADGSVGAIAGDGGIGTYISADVGRVWDGFPIGNALVVIAGQRASSSVLADTFNVMLKVTPRWKELRGAE